MRKISTFIFITFLTTICLCQDSKYKIDFTIKVEKIDEKYYFVFEGTTNLPDNSKLEIELNYISYLKVPDKENEFEESENVLECGKVQIKEGKFKLNVGGYKRKPFSKTYRGIIIFDIENQIDDVKEIVNVTDQIVKKCDLTIGTKEEFEREIEQVKKEIYEDFINADNVFKELRPAFLNHFNATKFNEEEWNKWKEDWLNKVKDIESRNDARIGKWLVWIETAAKTYVKGLCERLKNMLEECTQALIAKAKGVAKIETKAQEMMEGFIKTFNEELDQLGFDRPFDKKKATSILNDIKSNLNKLKEIIDKKNKEEWAKNKEDIEKKILDSIFELVDNIPTKTNKALADFSNNFQKLYSNSREFLEDKKDINKVDLMKEFDKLAENLKDLSKVIGIENSK